MKKLTSILLTIVLLCSIVPTVFAATDEAVDAANKLYTLGLFKGTGTDANGNPIFDLDAAPTRNQAIIMLVRLLGKEKEATSGTWETPFTDLNETAAPYIGYAYTNGLTAGTTATTFSGSAKVTANQYIVFVLRALGYESSKDFEYAQACDFAESIGLIEDNSYSLSTETFTRGDVTLTSYSALRCKVHNDDKTLVDKLIAESAVDAETVQRVMGDDSDNEDSDGSDKSGVPTDTDVPVDTTPEPQIKVYAPSKISIRETNGVAYLTWDGSDTNADEYEVVISQSQKTGYSTFCKTSQTKIAIMSATSYNFEESVPYYFKVRSVASGTDGTHYSDYTNFVRYYIESDEPEEEEPDTGGTSNSGTGTSTGNSNSSNTTQPEQTTTPTTTPETTTEPQTESTADKWAKYLAYKELIDARISAIKAEGDVYYGSESAYESKVNKLVSEIASLQNKADTLALDSSRQAQAERAKVLEELAEKQEELADLQAAHGRKASIDSLKQMLDSYYNELFGG